MLSSPWRVQLLGGLAVQNTEETITRFRTQRTGGLLAYLAYYAHRLHPREELVALFWPNSDLEAGRVSLRTALASLRRQLEAPGVQTEEILVADRINVQLRPEAIRTDVAEFEAARRAAGGAKDNVERLECLTRAVEAYGGTLLPGYYEDWITLERERLANAYQETLSQLAVLLHQSGQVEQALDYARRAVAIDPLNEESHCLLMRLYAMARKRDAALRQYALLKKTLREEIGAEPSLETQALLRQIQQSEDVLFPPAGAGAEDAAVLPEQAEGRRAARAKAPTGPDEEAAEQQVLGAGKAAAPLVRLPVVFTRFLGREQERERLLEQMAAAFAEPDAPGSSGYAPRLFTLTGPGGVGKTRLAVEIGRAVAARREAQTVFVELAEARRSEHIAPAIAAALGVSASEDAALEVTIQALRATPTLLILDNFEQLLGEAGEETAEGEAAVRLVQTLCAQAETLVCLITSRQRLNLGGEEEFPLAPLPLPEENASLATLQENPSIRLFLDRARAVRPDFQLTANNSSDVVALCRSVEGIPLAIELLAVWAQTLSPAQIRQRLAERMNLLRSRQRGVAARHSGLHACIEWSYRLLSPDLQQFFASLAVFRGGWTLEAAEAACDTPYALELLTQLRERSLLVAEEVEESAGIGAAEGIPGSTMRYRLLETLRVYAEEQLTPGLRAAGERRHLDYFADLTEKARAKQESAEQAAWYACLSREYDNIRGAFARCAATPESQRTGLRMSVNLCRFWETRGYYREGHAIYVAMLALPDVQTPSHDLATAYNGAGNLTYHQADLQAAQGYYAKSLELSRSLGDKPIMAITLSNLGNIASDQGRYEEAKRLYTESLQLKRETGSTPGNEAHTLATLGNVYFREKDFESARALYHQALSLHRSVGNAGGQLVVLANLAATALQKEGMAGIREAVPFYRQALTLCRQVGAQLFTAICLEGMAQAAFRREHDTIAVQLYSAAARVRKMISSPLAVNAAAEQARTLETIQTRSAQEFEAAWQQGQEMTADQAITVGLQAVTPLLI